jgi:ATP-dependent Lon protease
VKKIILPKGNEKNIKELPEEVRKNLKIVVADSMDQVLDHVLTKKLDWGIEHRRSLGGFFGSEIRKPAN